MAARKGHMITGAPSLAVRHNPEPDQFPASFQGSIAGLGEVL
jgi:hypothetical protein